MGRLLAALARRVARWRALVSATVAHRRIARGSRAAAGPRPVVFYGRELPRADDERAAGGIIKFQRLADAFPNTPLGFNVLYLGSSSPPPRLPGLIAAARRTGAAFAWNQDGVAYPGLGWDLERTNRPMADALREADHVFFQSEFCKRASDQFLGQPHATWEILYNAVDTAAFTPPRNPPGRLVLLLGGSQYEWYRLEAALRTVAALVPRREDVQLHVTGALSWGPDERANRRQADRLAGLLGVADRVVYRGRFAQRDAPALLGRASMLLHTKYNDPCPGAVIEAMACGLPVVYSSSGGVPELVGADAGVGVAAPEDFERIHPPDADALADAVEVVAARLDEYRAAARERALSRFDIRPWVDRHGEVFARLCA